MDKQNVVCACDYQGVASSIPQHADFHAVPQNSPFAAEFAVYRGKCGIAHFCYIYI